MYWFLSATAAYIVLDKHNCRKGVRGGRYFISIVDAFVACAVASGGAYQGSGQWR